MDTEPGRGGVPANIGYPLLLGDESVRHVFSLFRRYLFDHRREMPLPSAFLLDELNRVVRVYEGAVTTEELVADCNRIPRSMEERLKLGLPFPGRFYNGEPRHDYFTFGVAYMQHEYYDEAQVAFEQSLKRNQSNPNTYYDLGLIALKKGQLPEARSRLERAVELDPANADAWNNLGVTMGQLGDHEQARRDFQLALERQPAHPTAVQNMIRVLRYQNKPQEARAVLFKALETDPRQAQLHNQLGMLLAKDGDLQGAIAEFEKAVDLEPSNPEMLNDLGVARMQNGDNTRAMQIFETCLRLAPNYGLAVLNIATIYLAAGKLDAAHEVLSQFLEKNPENKEVRDALQEVDSRR